MKVLMVLQHSNFIRNLEAVVCELDRRGAETVILHGQKPSAGGVAGKIKPKKPGMANAGRGMQRIEDEIGSVSTGDRPLPTEPDQADRQVGRQVMNVASYLRPAHPAPDRTRTALEGLLPEDVRPHLEDPEFRRFIASPEGLEAWRRYEDDAEPSALLTRVLDEHRPDVILVSPGIWPKRPIEADYLYAGRRLGIPTVAYVNSWDNLTSKGTVHVLPDALMVWNEPMADEARVLHDVPDARIRVVGAAHTDNIFDAKPGRTRAEALAAMGCPAAGRYVTYLCSSRTLIADETSIVTALAEAVERELGQNAPTIVVRPHPVNAAVWDGYQRPGVVVYPASGDQADTPESWQHYFDQLHYGDASIGLNTTAFLEAAVADRPCMTIVSDEFHDQQGHTGHFRHLLAAGFLETFDGVSELATQLGAVLDGADERKAERRAFTGAFLRPGGRERPAAAVVVDELEALAATRVSPSPTVRASAPASEPDGPFFSIVVPTKNRPAEAARAVRSLVGQTDGDLEVVVCDNSDEDFAPKVEAAVAEAADDRVRYVRTNGQLSMPDNWERGLSETTGQYVGVLTDRSVFYPHALEKVRADIRATDAKVVTWVRDHFDESGKFVRRATTGNRTPTSAEDVFDYFLHGDPKYATKILPKIMTSVCERSVLEEIRRSVGRVCPPVAPDFTSGFLMTAYAGWVLWVDDSHYVAIGTGNGQAFRRGGPLAQRFRTDLGMEPADLVDRMPSEACFSHALVLNDLMRLRDQHPDRFGHLTIDPAQYYLGCLTDYVKTSRHGIKRSEDVAILLEALDAEPPEIQQRVKSRQLYRQAMEIEQTRPEPAELGKIAAISSSFPDVFAAMDWDRENPRKQAGNREPIDLNHRVDQMRPLRGRKRHPFVVRVRKRVVGRLRRTKRALGA